MNRRPAENLNTITAPGIEVSGQQGLAIQLIDQSPIAFDDVVFRDLVAAHATQTDQQVLYGSGANGQVLGVLETPNIQSVAIASLDIRACTRRSPMQFSSSTRRDSSCPRSSSCIPATGVGC